MESFFSVKNLKHPHKKVKIDNSATNGMSERY